MHTRDGFLLMSKHSLDFTVMANAFRYPSNRNDHESTIYTNYTLHILPAADFLVYLLFLSVFLLLSIERKLCDVSTRNLLYHDVGRCEHLNVMEKRRKL